VLIIVEKEDGLPDVLGFVPVPPPPTTIG